MTSFISPEDVSLSNLAQGAAIERFDIELKNVLKNVLDVNTDPKKKRKIKLTVTVSPSRDRDHADVEILCESTLAALESFSVPIYIGKDVHGNPIARQSHFKQTTFADLPQNQNKIDNVTTIERKAQ